MEDLHLIYWNQRAREQFPDMPEKQRNEWAAQKRWLERNRKPRAPVSKHHDVGPGVSFQRWSRMPHEDTPRLNVRALVDVLRGLRFMS